MSVMKPQPYSPSLEMNEKGSPRIKRPRPQKTDNEIDMPEIDNNCCEYASEMLIQNNALTASFDGLHLHQNFPRQKISNKQTYIQCSVHFHWVGSGRRIYA